LIFDIKRFAVHDGPGIRTTIFFKGCPLHCLWCHNPESIDRGRELFTRSSRCSRCYSCVPVCPKKALAPGPAKGPVVVNRAKCDLCGKCVEACAYEALEIVGREVGVDELVAEAERDRVFFEESGGGVTLSGGEPLAQPEFALALLEALRGRGLRTALDTSGAVRWDDLDRASSLADLVLYDLKLLDTARHQSFAGASNALPLENLRRLAERRRPIVIRIPLISGINDEPAHIGRMIAFLRPLTGIKRIDLLKYHRGGEEKYSNLGKDKSFRLFDPPSEARLEAIRKTFADAGYGVAMGG
jgi:pyruvate formate lyase activating enzyme